MPSTDTPPSITSALIEIAKSPVQTLVLGWNWKAAFFSALIRATIFFFTTLKAGAAAALTATLAEAIFAAVVVGILGSITQRLRNATPAWLAGVVVSVFLPMVLQILQYWFHLALHTPHLKAGMIATYIYAAVALLFNWFAMRHNALITGSEGRPLWRDMVEMPKLVALFVAAAPMALWKKLASHPEE